MPYSLAGQRVLVVGASGFIGANLTRRLAANGAEVIAFSRGANSEQWAGQPGIRPWRGDAGDKAQVETVFAQIRPDLVYHLTSDSRGGREIELIADSIRNDVMATLQVMEAVHRFGTKRLVVTASLEEPLGEAGSAVPSSPYAAAKWMSAGYARMLAALHGLPVVVLRLMMTYGPGQKEYKVIPSTILSLLRGQPARLSSGVRAIDWVYVDDVADALLRAGLVAYPGAASIDVGTGTMITLRDLLGVVGELTGRPDLLQFGGQPDRALEMERAAETEPAERLLGWRAGTSLRDGLARTIDAYSRLVTT